MPGVCEVSVVMATYNRLDLLRKAVDALLRQRAVVFEIIVADDGSSDGTVDYLADVAEDSPVPFRFVTTGSNGGPAVARNAAWPLSSAPYVAFTDDDCVADPGWLRALLDAAADSGADIVQGRTIIDPTAPVYSPWFRGVACESFSHKYQTCNLLVRTPLLSKLGGFDDSISFAGEDCDLGWRAREQGFASTFVGEALVVHARRELTFFQLLRVRSRWAELVRFYKRHPEARQLLLYRGLFFRRRHVTVLAGLALGALLSTLGAWSMGPAMYVAYSLYLGMRVRFEGHGWTLRWKNAFLVPLADSWEIAHFIVYSVRYRTLVL